MYNTYKTPKTPFQPSQDIYDVEVVFETDVATLFIIIYKSKQFINH